MDEFCFGVMAQVVISKERVGAQEVSCLKALLLKRLLVHVVSNTNLTLCDEVHLQYFLFLIIDYVLILFLTKVPWF